MNLSSTSRRVAERYTQARVASILDEWVDVFLDELARNTQFNEQQISQALQANGLSADTVNDLGNKQAGEAIQALGGWVRKSLWYLLVRPFLVIGKIFKSSSFRHELRQAFSRAMKKDVRGTKHMLDVIQRMAHGESVNDHERRAALQQFVRIMSIALFITLAGPSVSSLFTGTVWRTLATLMSPVEDVLMILLHRPIQAAAAKLLTTQV